MGTPLQSAEGNSPAMSALKLHVSIFHTLFIDPSPAGESFNLLFSNIEYNRNFTLAVGPSANNDCIEIASKLADPARPTRITGTPSPCTAIGTHLVFQFATFIIG